MKPKPEYKYFMNKATSNEMKWGILRFARDQMLTDSDWTQMPDSPVDKKAWAKYRQQLRDITKDFKKPDDVVFPDYPE